MLAPLLKCFDKCVPPPWGIYLTDVSHMRAVHNPMSVEVGGLDSKVLVPDAPVYAPRHSSVLKSAECTQPSWEQAWTNRAAQTSSEVPGAGGPRIAKQKCQLTFSELVLYRNWFVGPAVSPSLRKHGLSQHRAPRLTVNFLRRSLWSRMHDNMFRRQM